MIKCTHFKCFVSFDPRMYPPPQSGHKDQLVTQKWPSAGSLPCSGRQHAALVIEMDFSCSRIFRHWKHAACISSNLVSLA